MGRYYFIVTTCVVCMLAMASSALAYDLSEKFRISGELTTYAKVQDDYQTPLDEVANVREGANYRSDQHFRAKAYVNMTYGKPGDKFFGLAQVNFDANDPDVGDEENDNSSEAKLDVDSVFAMYRPFEVNGGRPLGISVGVLPIKATANCAYFNKFEGDIDDDFIFYTCTALPEVPGINVDFHFTKDIGIGAAYVEGIDDGSEIGAFMEKDSAENFVLWAEAKKWGFGFNGAVQFVDGEADADVEEITPAGNELASYTGESSHTLGNAQLTYTMDLGGFQVMPAVGLLWISGEKCEISPTSPERDIDMKNYQAGLKFFTNLFDIPGELSILYTAMDTDEFKGLGTLSSSGINEGIDDTGVAAGLWSDGTWTTSNAALGSLADAPAVAAAETSEAVTPVAGIDNDLHVEYKFKLTDRIEMGLFYYSMSAETISASEIANEAFSQLDGSATDQRLTLMTGSSAAADQILQGYSQAVGENLAQTWEWTDQESFGIFFNILF